MSRPIPRNRLGLSFRVAAVLLLLAAMPLLSQTGISSVKDPTACPFGGLASCGTAFLSFSFRTGFHVIYATPPRTYKLGSYGLGSRSVVPPRTIVGVSRVAALLGPP